MVPPKPTNYQIVDEEGNILKEGTLEGTNIIHLSGIETRRFKVLLDSYVVTQSEGYESPQSEEESLEQSDTQVPESSGIDSTQDIFVLTGETSETGQEEATGDSGEETGQETESEEATSEDSTEGESGDSTEEESESESEEI